MSSSEKPREVTILRHGQSISNTLERVNGVIPAGGVKPEIVNVPDHRIPLTALGVRQAIAAGKYLAEHHPAFDVVYYSNYLRAKQTMAFALRQYERESVRQMKLRPNVNLGERQSGYIHNQDDAFLKEYFNWYQDYHKKVGYFYARPPGGESQHDVCRRVEIFIGNHLLRYRAGARVLIVCHGGIIRGFRYNFEKWSISKYEKDVKSDSCGNCSITSYALHEQTNQLRLERCYDVGWQKLLDEPVSL